MKETIKTWVARTSSLVIVITFLVIIFLPMIDQGLGLHLDKARNTEKRTLAVRPHFSFDSLETYSSRYEAYYNDNFSFRNSLVKLNSVLESKAYNVSASPDVMIGNDGWLFYIAKGQGNSREDYMGRLRVDPSLLELIRTKLEKIDKDLHAQGIRLIVCVAPDKHSVYPDYLPDTDRRKGRYPARLDQIITYLKKNSSVQILDLRNLLIESRKTDTLPLFKKTDTHWNFFGAFVAYQGIMESISIVPKAKTDFKWEIVETTSGLDLAGMLGASDRFLENSELTFTPLFQNEISFTPITDYGLPIKGSVLIASNKDQSLPKLVMFHDSFGAGMQPFLSFHFRECVFIGTRYSKTIVEREKPDVVILETVERYVDQVLGDDSYE